MADTVTSQTLVDGPRNAVMHFTGISDGTGETAVLKVDVSALSGAPSKVRIDRVVYMTVGMGVRILWDATTPVPALTLPADKTDHLDFKKVGGLQNPQATGWTGDIKFTTTGATAGDAYSVTLHMVKG